MPRSIHDTARAWNRLHKLPAPTSPTVPSEDAIDHLRSDVIDLSRHLIDALGEIDDPTHISRLAIELSVTLTQIGAALGIPIERCVRACITPGAKALLPKLVAGGWQYEIPFDVIALDV